MTVQPTLPLNLPGRPERWETSCGVLLLILVGLKLWHDLDAGTPANMLWLCYLGNLLMSAGLLATQRRLVRIGMLWALAGLPLWLVDVVVHGTSLPSVLSHVGGVSVALLVWSCRCWAPQRNDWLLAWLGALAMQAFARFFTPPALNVNLAHAVHVSSAALFSSYPVYAVAVAAGMGTALYVLQQLLQAAKRRFPMSPALPSGVQR